ncbi:MAG: BON domain-containing protein [Ectothiorhodospiraceae bacterium]|jgi:osmotically-inducible protein OsmY
MVPDSPNHLIASIHAAFERDPRMNVHACPVELRLVDGVLQLSGRMDTIAAKRLAGQAARRIAGSELRVDDGLRVAAEATEDAALRDEIVNALTRESAFRDYTLVTLVGDRVETVHDAGADAYSINIDIHDGTVRLSGQVGSLSHQRLAEVLTWWTSGCESVENRLEISPPEQDNDDEITDAVCMVLEKDPLVHPGQLHVTTANAVVTLEGSVASDEERRLAVLDTWYVPGVVEVLDQIGVR